MPLNFDMKNVKDHDTVAFKPDGEVTPKAWALIHATMFVQMGKITEDNAEEFHRRLALWEQENGTFLHEKGKPYYLTLEDVKKFVGMTTNVSTESKRTWEAYFKDVKKRNARQRETVG